MEDGLAFMKLSSWTTPVVTSDGEIIEPSGVITGGGASCPRRDLSQETRDRIAYS